MHARRALALSMILAGAARADHPIDVGVFVGAHWFDDASELGSKDDDPTNDAPKTAPAIGLRASVKIIPRLAVEGELGFMASGAEDGSGTYKTILWRAHLVFYPLPKLRRVQPLILAGGGAESTFPSGAKLFDDTDVMFHAGVGAEVKITDRIGARVDARILFPPARFGNSFTEDYEILAGATYRFGPRPAKAVAVVEEAPKLHIEVTAEDRDTDGDGVNDAKDKCPNEAETVNGFQDDDGCPDTIPAELQKLEGPIAGLEFETGSAKMTKASQKILDGVAVTLAKYPTTKWEIDGYTDDQGKPDDNVKLSGARADAVKQYLAGKGVQATMLNAVGHGPADPIADNKTRDGRAKNRRVELHRQP